MKQLLYELFDEDDIRILLADKFDLPASAVEVVKNGYEVSFKVSFKVPVPYEKVVIDNTDYLVRKR